MSKVKNWIFLDGVLLYVDFVSIITHELNMMFSLIRFFYWKYSHVY